MSFSIIKAAALCTTSIIPIDLFDLKALEAHADPVTSALVAIGFSATAAAFVVQVGLSLAFSTLSRLLAPKPSFESGGIQTDVTLSGSKTPQKIILGFYATNGCLAVAPLSRHGSNRKKMNYWLNYVTVISDLPINELLGVIVDGKEQTIIDADNNEFGRKVSGDLDGTARFRWYLGNQTSADDYLLESYGEHPQFPWTTQHILKGCAYVISSFYYDDERYTNLPSTRFIVKGASLYDPRKDSSVGGNGPQRWNDRSTWTFTANPIVMVYNLIRGITMPDGLVYGVRAPAEKLPLSSWFAAMNVCDEAGTQPNSTDWKADRKRYQAGIEISLDTEPLEVIEELLKAAGAELSEAGGYFYVRAGAPSAPVAHITDDVIIVSDPISERPFQGLNESFNTVRATYPDPAAVWESTEAEPFSKPEWVAADQGLELVADIKLSAVPFPRQVRRLMREAAADHRRRRVHTLTLPPSYLGLKPLDSISWTSPSRFYEAKVFEVQQVRINPMTLNVQIDIKERNPADYDIDAANDSIAPYYPPPPPVPQEEIGMDGLAVAGVVVKDAAGNPRLPGIKVSWDLADDGTSYDAVNYQVRLKSSGAVVVTGTTQATDVGSVTITESLLPNEIYQVRAKVHEPESGVRWRYSNWIDVTTPNVRISPIDLDDTIFDQMKETAIRHGVKPVTTLPATGQLDQLVMQVPTGKLYRWNGSAWVSELVAAPTPGSVNIASFAMGIEPITPWTGTALPTTKITSLLFWNGETYRWSGTAYVKNIAASDITGQIVANQIANSAITTAKFAAGIEPVTISTANTLPTTKTTTTLTWNGKLYRWNGSAYTASVAASDMAGQLTNDQIASIDATKVAGQLTNDQIADIEAAKLTGQITEVQIGNNVITTPKIAANAVVANNIAAGAVVAGKLAVNSVTANNLSVNSVTANSIAAGAVVAGKLAVNAVTANNLAAGSVTAYSIATDAVTANAIAAGAVVAGTIAAGAVRATEIAANAIQVIHFSANCVTTYALAAGAVTANNIAAGAVTTDKLDANAVTAGKVAAGAIGTNQLAANSVVASKVAISDFSNLVPDADFSEFWAGGSTWVAAGGLGPFQAFSVVGTPGWASPYILRQNVNGTGDTNYSGVQSSTFAVTGGTDYHVSALLQTQGSGGANVILRLAFYNNAGALLGQRNVYADTANLGVDRKTANVTAHANAAYARVQMYIRNDSVASYVQMGSLAVRKAAGGELIVDGSVKGNHISSNTLTSNHHTTGSLLAEHINTSSFNAAGLAVFNNVLQSNNFVANTSGWRIQQNGNAEFNSLKVRSDMIVSGAVSKTYYQQFQTFTKDDTSVWEGVIPLGSGLSFAAAEDDGGALLNPIRTEFYCSLGRRSSVSSCRIAVTLWASTAANPNAWINLYGTNSEFNSIYLASKELEGGEALAVNGLLIGGVYSSILFERIANLKVRVVMDTGKGVVYRPKVIVSQISR